MIPWSLLLLCLVPLTSVHAQVTIYGQTPLGQIGSETATAADAAMTTLAAYNDTILEAPGIPDPAPPTQFTLELQADSGAVTGLSIPHRSGSLWGFSIEMSVLTQICELVGLVESRFAVKLSMAENSGEEFNAPKPNVPQSDVQHH
jgi:hypothetical protein